MPVALDLPAPLEVVVSKASTELGDRGERGDLGVRHRRDLASLERTPLLTALCTMSEIALLLLSRAAYQLNRVILRFLAERGIGKSAAVMRELGTILGAG